MDYTSTQIILLWAAFALAALASFGYFNSWKDRWLMLILFLSGICVFSFAALLDPFLNLWDERFHALVAKNMLDHPLKPTLYDDPVLNMPYDRWDRFHIWLHKQPLFLWQMALSFKAFGVSLFSLRLPSVLLASTLVPIAYRVGKLIWNKRVGFITAILVLSSVYLVELVSGRQEVDHNDVSFLAYISLSIWSWVEYQYSQKRYWIVLIGIFSGFAILCKWLVGLLIYAGWGIIRIQERKFSPNQNGDMLLAMLFTAIIAVPWQILIAYWYPQEAAAAQTYNTLHLWEAVEGHGGGVAYHILRFPELFGWICTLLVVPGILRGWQSKSSRKATLALGSMMIIALVFYSLAATKMPSFTVIIALSVFVFTAVMLDRMIGLLPDRRIQPIVLTLLLLGAFFVRFNRGQIESKHGNGHSEMMAHNTQVFIGLNLPKGTVIFNVKGRHYVECMFFTGHTAYNFIPSREQVEYLQSQNRGVAIFRTETEVPDYLIEEDITWIGKEIRGYP